MIDYFEFAIAEKINEDKIIRYLVHSHEKARDLLQNFANKNKAYLIKLNPHYQPSIGDSFKEIHPFIIDSIN